MRIPLPSINTVLGAAAGQPSFTKISITDTGDGMRMTTFEGPADELVSVEQDTSTGRPPSHSPITDDGETSDQTANNVEDVSSSYDYELSLLNDVNFNDMDFFSPVINGSNIPNQQTTQVQNNHSTALADHANVDDNFYANADDDLFGDFEDVFNSQEVSGSDVSLDVHTANDYSDSQQDVNMSNSTEASMLVRESTPDLVADDSDEVSSPSPNGQHITLPNTPPQLAATLPLSANTPPSSQHIGYQQPLGSPVKQITEDDVTSKLDKLPVNIIESDDESEDELEHDEHPHFGGKTTWPGQGNVPPFGNDTDSDSDTESSATVFEDPEPQSDEDEFDEDNGNDVDYDEDAYSEYDDDEASRSDTDSDSDAEEVAVRPRAGKGPKKQVPTDLECTDDSGDESDKQDASSEHHPIALKTLSGLPGRVIGDEDAEQHSTEQDVVIHDSVERGEEEVDVPG